MQQMMRRMASKMRNARLVAWNPLRGVLQPVSTASSTHDVFHPSVQQNAKDVSAHSVVQHSRSAQPGSVLLTKHPLDPCIPHVVGGAIVLGNSSVCRTRNWRA